MRRFADFVSETSLDVSARSQAPDYLFGIHIRYIYYFHVIGTTVVNIVGIVLSLVVFFYPHLHRESYVYTQILQHFERTNVHSYYFWYHFIVFFFLGNFIVQILTSLIGIFGTKIRNQFFLWPHLVVITVHVGTLLIIFGSLILINVLLDKWVIVWPLISLFFGIAAIIDLVITVRCCRYVEERNRLMKAYTAQTKQVHFKKSKKRNH